MSRRLNRKEIEESYPLMLKFFGDEFRFGDAGLEIECIDGPGKSGAHMIFAPAIEHALKKAAQNRLWEEFKFTVSVRRLAKRPRRKS